eukprot:COSAG01_NODE_1031_length_12014_cov_27.936131_7_plen_202_part_00
MRHGEARDRPTNTRAGGPSLLAAMVRWCVGRWAVRVTGNEVVATLVGLPSRSARLSSVLHLLASHGCSSACSGLASRWLLTVETAGMASAIICQSFVDSCLPSHRSPQTHEFWRAADGFRYSINVQPCKKATPLFWPNCPARSRSWRQRGFCSSRAKAQPFHGIPGAEAPALIAPAPPRTYRRAVSRPQPARLLLGDAVEA